MWFGLSCKVNCGGCWGEGCLRVTKESGFSPGSDRKVLVLTVLNQVALIQGALLGLPLMVLMIDFHDKIL